MARIRTMSLRCSPAPRREERKKERPWNVARVIAARRANRSCQKEKKKKKENMEERSPSRFQDRDYVRVRAHRVEWDRVEKNFRGKHSKYIYIVGTLIRLAPIDVQKYRSSLIINSR